MKLSPLLLVTVSSVFLAIASPTAVKVEHMRYWVNKDSHRTFMMSSFGIGSFDIPDATSANAESCSYPNRNFLVQLINQPTTDTQGYIARDDDKKEIIVVFIGISSLEDTFTDLLIIPIAFKLPVVNAPALTLSCPHGIFRCWNSVAIEAISSVQAELAAYPGYAIVYA